MTDKLPSSEDDYGFDMNAVFEFLQNNVAGFKPYMVKTFFDASPDDPLMNMGWGARRTYREEIAQLEKLKKSLNTQARKFQGTLGVHEHILSRLHTAAVLVTDHSLQKYRYFFGSENRGKPSWAARTVAALCYTVIKQCGRTPTIGTAPTSDAPTGEYCKLVEGALKAADLEAHWNSPAIWAYEYYSDFKK